MIHKVLIPQAFENMEEATIGRWIKAEDDRVSEGDALCELITEKTSFDLPAEDVPPGETVLRRIVAPEKSVVPVGYCIAILGEAKDELPDVEAENAEVLSKRQTSETNAPAAVVNAPVIAPAQITPAAGSRVRATPAARRLAKERGVSIEEIASKLAGKVVTEEDVANFAA
jgi:pyruvate dehydrogenase E2 component (dihydrolipoamide acetyltransferase)